MLDFFRPAERVPNSISSKRVMLRQFRTSDAEEYATLFSESFLGHLDRWSPPTPADAYGDKARSSAREHILAALDKWDEGTDYRFFIRALDLDGAIVGQIGLTNIVRGAFQSCFIGYWIGKAFVNRGYVTEATVLALEFAFEHLHLHRSSLWIGINNVESLRVPEKLGLRFEGTAQRALFLGGEWKDTHIYAVTVEEWQERRETLLTQFAPNG